MKKGRVTIANAQRGIIDCGTLQVSRFTWPWGKKTEKDEEEELFGKITVKERPLQPKRDGDIATE